MKISQNDWIRYREMMSKISKKAAEEFDARFQGKLDTVERKDVIDYAMALVEKYSEASSELACQMYERIAELSGVDIPPAVPAAVAEYSEVAKGINGTLKQSPEGKLCSDVVDRLVKRAGADTMLQNAQRDHAQFAWIPHGDTCSFCIMLASRGWQNISKRALKNGHAEHIHAHCDCQYCVRFNQNTDVEGYDPDQYLEIYNNAEGDTWRDKLNAMRREAYSEKQMFMTGGRILNPDGEYERKWAKSYYEEIRHKSTDCMKIAKKIGTDEETIKSIKNYLFFEGEWYNPITERNEKFVPDAAIAQSWQRLAEGKKLEPHDLTLIKHEVYEMSIKKETPGIDHDDAHALATQKYNYQKEAEDYYANLRKSSKKG